MLANVVPKRVQGETHQRSLLCIVYNAIQLASRKRGKKTGKNIGKAIPDTGFIPNRNYHLYNGEESQDNITIPKYSPYPLIEVVIDDIPDSPKQFSPAN